MSITLRDLVQQPHLQLTVVAGETGLDREVSWAHTSDLPNPWEWMGPGELLLTNGTNLGGSGAMQIAYLNRLQDNGTSGLVVGLGTSSRRVTRQLARRADELGFALLTVPYCVPFTSVVRCVATANDREESQQLAAAAQFYDLLRSSLAAGRTGAELFGALGRRLGVRLSLVDAETGASLVPGQGESAFAPSLVSAYHAHGRAIPAVLRLLAGEAGPAPRGAVAVAVPGTAGTALVVEPLGAAPPSPLMLQHLAIAGAMELTRLVAADERDRRLGADGLCSLLDGRHDPVLAYRQMDRAGLVLSECVVGAVRESTPETEESIHGQLARARVPHLLVARDDVVFVLLPAGDVDGAFAEATATAGTVAGIGGDLTAPDRVAVAAREAQWALGVAEAEGRPLGRYGEATSLLLPRTPVEAAALVQRILGPLLRHDAVHGTDYVRTLRAVLDHDRSWQAAAHVLHIHRQTLGYRLRRIEELSGRGTTATGHLAEWWFALQAQALLAISEGARPDG